MEGSRPDCRDSEDHPAAPQRRAGRPTFISIRVLSRRAIRLEKSLTHSPGDLLVTLKGNPLVP